MAAQILNVEHGRDWSELAALLLDSQADPYQSYFRRLHPVSIRDPDSRELEIDQLAKKLRKECVNDPTSYTVKAVDTETGLILGLSIWNIRTASQSINEGEEPRCEFTMYADDGEIELISEDVERMEIARAGPTDLPHIFLYTIATRSTPTGGEVGKLLMDWGLERADLLGIETWAYTSSPETSLYSMTGFEAFGKLSVRPGAVSLEEHKSGVTTPFRPFTIWSIRRGARRNREKYRAHYTDTNGFW
ncbi:hypothetical protein BDV96DRAFT_594627 [Lophiotrema nucula]|uniref:N-acetyltransferase domain-containing protein n=1 Tax=Lophiotrema nucula TaxID=690887 RepID=A0A6A5ZQA2_9PLEO|nr:hypothetical protein BDV96DRAFT_594627 [Lophiotrema nucula]